MIQVKNLKKTYLGKKNIKSRGLVDVSFDLPSKGFVFVLGKSGSGKSTLLNLLGKLDEKTSGKIYIDGKDIDTFTKEEEDFYRSTYCGFIFQDYQLINELTVKENIALSLELINDQDNKEERIKEILKKVELEDYENRHPTELSGGQKQRVSIARALIKNPKLVLCDEPTGNLDKKTSIAILNLLEEISKNCLIFMVSHDEKNSLRYAQRRIILEDGLVIKDEYRDESYKNNFFIDGRKAYLPFEKEITDEECNLLNEKIKSGEVNELTKIGNGFNDNNKVVIEDGKFEFKKETFDKASFRKLSKKYIQSGMTLSIINEVLFSLLTVLLILIESLLSFETNNVFYDNINLDKKDTLVITKTDEDIENYLPFTQEDEENIFFDLNCKNYKVYNFTPSITNFASHEEIDEGIVKNAEKYLNQHQVYPGIAIGTAVVDGEYLTDRFKNEKGELEILAGSLDDCKDSLHLILTDFMADAILDSIYESCPNYQYEDLIGPYKTYFYDKMAFSNCIGSYFGCIIKTNYKEKYKAIFDKYEEAKNNRFSYKIMNDIINSSEYIDYYNDVINGELTLCFSINPNFYNQYVEESTSIREYSRIGGLFISSDEIVDEDDIQSNSLAIVVNNELNDGEIYLKQENKYQYESLFDVADIVGKEIFFIKTTGNALDGNIQGVVKLKVMGYKPNCAEANEETVRLFNEIQLSNYAYLISTDSLDVEKVFSNAMNNKCSVIDLNSRVYNLVGKTTLVFGDIFRMLEVLVIIVLVALFALFSIRNVRSKNYQIGVFKSLGMADKNIRSIFLTKNVLFGMISLLLTSLLIYPFFCLANTLIISAYSKYLEIVLNELTIFYFHPTVFIIDYSFLIIVFVLFTLVPLFMIKKVSPAKIVNNKAE